MTPQDGSLIRGGLHSLGDHSFEIVGRQLPTWVRVSRTLEG